MTYWTCRRRAGGNVCRTRNTGRKRKCTRCGKPRPARVKAAHLVALDLPYEAYLAITGREECAICHRGPTRGRRLDRDHDHTTGRPRGLLCVRCNRALPAWMDVAWLRSATRYLEAAGGS